MPLVGTDPELLRGQSLQSGLPPHRVPVDDVCLEVRLEGLEVRPRPVPGELVLDVAEQALRACVVQAVALPGHALHDARLLQPAAVGLVLVLPAHVRVHHRMAAVGHLGRRL